MSLFGVISRAENEPIARFRTPNTCKTTFLEDFHPRLLLLLWRRQQKLDKMEREHHMHQQSERARNQLPSQRAKDLLSDVQHHTWSEKLVIIDDRLCKRWPRVFRNYIDRYGHNVHLLLHVAVFRKWSTVCNPSSLRPPTPLLPRSPTRILIHSHKGYIEPTAREYLVSLSSCSFRCLLRLSRKNTDHPSPHSEWGLPSPPPTRVSWLSARTYARTFIQKYLTSIWGSWKLETLKALKLLFSLHDNGFFRLGHSGQHFLIYKHPISSQSLNESEKYKAIQPCANSIKIFPHLTRRQNRTGFFCKSACPSSLDRKNVFWIYNCAMSSKMGHLTSSYIAWKVCATWNRWYSCNGIFWNWCARKKVIQLHPDKNPISAQRSVLFYKAALDRIVEIFRCIRASAVELLSRVTLWWLWECKDKNKRSENCQRTTQIQRETNQLRENMDMGAQERQRSQTEINGFMKHRQKTHVESKWTGVGEIADGIHSRKEYTRRLVDMGV
jgi:hypothetical protein